MKAFRTFGCVLMTAILLVGCGGGGGIDVKLYPVTGTATKDGKSLAGVKVMLETSDPKQKSPMLYGVVKDDGSFEIQTSSGEKGAPAGSYNIFLSPPPVEFDYAKPTKGGPKVNTDLIPKELQSSVTSGLSCEVSSSLKPLEIKIP